MAKPIKETPFLTGRDAVKFINDNKKVKKVSIKSIEEINKSYKALKDIAQFAI